MTPKKYPYGYKSLLDSLWNNEKLLEEGIITEAERNRYLKNILASYRAYEEIEIEFHSKKEWLIRASIMFTVATILIILSFFV